MKKRVGTLTLGISLVGWGVGGLVCLFYPAIRFVDILRFWPAILLLLGAEILYHALTAKGADIAYDGASIAFTIITVIVVYGLNVFDTVLRTIIDYQLLH